MDERVPSSKSWWSVLNRWTLHAIVILVIYVLSSGPVIALACWLREWTGNDAFYYVFWVYFPLLMFGHNNPIMWYIEWWVVDVFDTVGPG